MVNILFVTFHPTDDSERSLPGFSSPFLSNQQVDNILSPSGKTHAT